MLELRPVGYVIGLLTSILGATMLIPMGVDLLFKTGGWAVFLECAIITILSGGLMALACSNGVTDRLSLQQTFLVAASVWLVLPIFAALPSCSAPPGHAPSTRFSRRCRA